MTTKNWIVTAILILLLGCGPAVMIPYWVSQQFVNFRDHNDMRIVGQRTESNFSGNGCQAHWVQYQTFRTERTNLEVWRKTKTVWDTLSGEYIGHINTATYEDQTFQPILFKSTVTYAYYEGYSSIQVTKQAVLQLPTQLCDLF